MSQSGSELKQAEERLDNVQAVLDDVRRVLVVAEKAQEAAEHARRCTQSQHLGDWECRCPRPPAVDLTKRPSSPPTRVTVSRALGRPLATSQAAVLRRA